MTRLASYVGSEGRMSSPLSVRASAVQSGTRPVSVGVALGLTVSIGAAVGVGLADVPGVAHAATTLAPAIPARRRKRRRSITGAASGDRERPHLVHGGGILER